MNWWNERFINRRDYILEHLADITMTSDETLLVLLIDFFNQHQIAISHSLLAEKMKKDMDEIDDLLSQLSAKGYLAINYKDGKIVFEIDGVFEHEQKVDDHFDQSLFDLFESEFKRPLSSLEFQRLVEWTQAYDPKLVGYALREALTYNSLSFDYIDRILIEWSKRGFSADEYEEGKR